MNNNSVKYVFLILWLGLLAYLISLMLEICKSDNEESSENPTTSANSETTTTSNERMNNTFDYTENFEPNDPKDIGNQAASKNEVSQQEISFDPPVDNSEVLVQNVTQEDEDEIAVEGTDALIAASSDRFYSVDTKGQTNRNASNDLRGDLPIAYNANYTPFNQSAIYGEPLVPSGRL